jgi:hypothetical protein
MSATFGQVVGAILEGRISFRDKIGEWSASPLRTFTDDLLSPEKRKIEKV